MKYNHTECLKLFGGKRVAFEGREAGSLKGPFSFWVGRNDTELAGSHGKGLPAAFPVPG